MFRSPLYDRLSASGARMGEYCSTETALVFADALAELHALRHGCGVYDLGWKSSFLVSGEDRTRWLNGMVTNNIRDLEAGRGNYSFVLNAQGRIQGDVHVYNRGEWLWAVTAREQRERLLALLDRYIIMDQIELSPLDDLVAVGLQGPQAQDVLERAGFERPVLEPLQIANIAWREHPVLLTRTADPKCPTYEMWIAPEHVASLWDSLVSAGATPTGTEALEMLQIAAGIPRYGKDIGERDLPQETGQFQALHFSKGCYIGQEIVERIRARGQVLRTFTGFVVDGEPPEPGTKIQREDKEVGVITSARRIPSEAGPRTLALGFVRREFANPGATVQIGNSHAIVSSLPFAEALL